ncbi:MAG: hypothetical protein IJ441_09425 [Spirochaetaceae bacterium]|nr:hypothetical protein [Spirochaetaceae bacterium]
MVPKTNLKEFQREFTQRTGDSIKKLVMAKIVETPAYVIKELGLEFPPGQEILWGLLILGQQDIHFFVHATESSLATMFRNATNGRPPTGAVPVHPQGTHLPTGARSTGTRSPLPPQTPALPTEKAPAAEAPVPPAGEELHPDSGAGDRPGGSHSPTALLPQRH